MIRLTSLIQRRYALIAQLVEQLPLKQTVGGSNPPGGTEIATICSCGVMDNTTVFGTVDGGSIPSESTKQKNPINRVFLYKKLIIIAQPHR
jgi:hypothetical protein